MKPDIVMLKDVKKGSYFRYGKKIYIRDDYERSSKKYLCMPVDDVWGTGKLIDGKKLVDIGIEY